MMAYPLTMTDLATWEEWLDYLNRECIVPELYLSKVLPADVVSEVLAKRVKSQHNIPYNAPHAHLSKRYINEAWFWAQVLKPLLPSVKKIIELCPGASIVIDLALSYHNFDQTLEKIDYQTWDHLEKHVIGKTYSQAFRSLNVITQVGEIKQADVVILNHSIDDLFMGLWNEYHQCYYWDVFQDWETVDAYWNKAMQEEHVFLPRLRTFIRELALCVKPGGWLIIRDYPSAYETNRKHLARINFTRKITIELVHELLKTGMERKIQSFGVSEHPLVQDSFFCLQNSRC